MSTAAPNQPAVTSPLPPSIDILPDDLLLHVLALLEAQER